MAGSKTGHPDKVVAGASKTPFGYTGLLQVKVARLFF
jgi:hypothetical protein